jgi:hypothetical protein
VVRSIAGRELTVVPLIAGTGDPGAADPPVTPPDPYRTPWQEGRPTAQFRIDRAGTYTVTAYASDTATSTRDYNDLLTSHVAVAPEGKPARLGSGWGLLVVAFVPLSLGLIVLAIARLRWPRPRSRSRRYPAPAA